MEKLKPSYWMLNAANALKNNMAVSEKVKYRITIWPAILLLSIDINEMNIWACKNIYRSVYSIIICTTQKLKTTQCPSSNKWINKMIHSYYRILYCNQKEHSTDTCYNINDPWKPAK